MSVCLVSHWIEVNEGGWSLQHCSLSVVCSHRLSHPFLFSRHRPLRLCLYCCSITNPSLLCSNIHLSLSFWLCFLQCMMSEWCYQHMSGPPSHCCDNTVVLLSPRTPQHYTSGSLTHPVHPRQLSVTDQSSPNLSILALFFQTLAAGWDYPLMWCWILIPQLSLLWTSDGSFENHTNFVTLSFLTLLIPFLSVYLFCCLEAKAIAHLSENSLLCGALILKATATLPCNSPQT